jgi:hypothetical protein
VALVKTINDGIGIEETSVVFSFSPAAYMPRADDTLTVLSRFSKDGNVYTTKAHCVDTAMWEIGGVAVALRLIQLAKVMLGSCFLAICSIIMDRHRTNSLERLVFSPMD